MSSVDRSTGIKVAEFALETSYDQMKIGWTATQRIVNTFRWLNGRSEKSIEKSGANGAVIHQL